MTSARHARHVRMVEVGGGPDLGEETICAECRSELRVQDVHGDGAIVLEIAREIASGHPATRMTR